MLRVDLHCGGEFAPIRLLTFLVICIKKDNLVVVRLNIVILMLKNANV